MKASELISQLQESITTHGDLSVYLVDDGAHAEARELEVDEAGLELTPDSKHQDLPKRFTLT